MINKLHVCARARVCMCVRFCMYVCERECMCVKYVKDQKVFWTDGEGERQLKQTKLNNTPTGGTVLQ